MTEVFPLTAFAAAMAALIFWLQPGEVEALRLRIPSGNAAAAPERRTDPENRNRGTLVSGRGKPAQDQGVWNRFRGPDAANIAADTGLLRRFPDKGPDVLWKKRLGEGHAGAAVYRGRVYTVDYDREKKEDVIRCFSLENGEDIWAYSYYVKIKRNHGMSRTIPSVTSKYIVSIGPMCHVTCLDSKTGELLWKKDLVKEYGTTVPPWYTGQCPLIDGDAVILAPGGTDVLMVKVDIETGSELWSTDNPGSWEMTHSSPVFITVSGIRQYVYCASKGVAGVSAADGHILWKDTSWRINPANVPTPVSAGEGRILLTGGYGAGSRMIRLAVRGDTIKVREVFRCKPRVFGSEQQTPILYGKHVYGVIPSGELACITLDGKQVWRSGRSDRYGLGPYCIADGMIYVVNDQKGTLHLVEASPAGFREITRTRVLEGHDAWAPMALVSGRLILRDLHDMVCIDIKGERGNE